MTCQKIETIKELIKKHNLRQAVISIALNRLNGKAVTTYNMAVSILLNKGIEKTKNLKKELLNFLLSIDREEEKALTLLFQSIDIWENSRKKKKKEKVDFFDSMDIEINELEKEEKEEKEKRLSDFYSQRIKELKKEKSYLASYLQGYEKERRKVLSKK